MANRSAVHAASQRVGTKAIAHLTRLSENSVRRKMDSGEIPHEVDSEGRRSTTMDALAPFLKKLQKLDRRKLKSLEQSDE